MVAIKIVCCQEKELRGLVLHKMQLIEVESKI